MESWHGKITIFEFLKLLLLHFSWMLLIFKPQILVFMWSKRPITLIFLIAAVFLVLFSFYFLIISPIIFNFFIVPNIEHKTGQKLSSRLIDEYIWLGKWMNTQTWTAIYIINRYFAWKLKKDEEIPTSKYFQQFPLTTMNYTIEKISKAEIFFSFILIIVMILLLLIAISFGIPLIAFNSYILAH